MRKLIITENDKKEILNKYKVASVDNRKIISEHQRISELMGVKPKSLILEDGGGKYSWITEMPIFSGWKSVIDESPTVIREIESDMSKISQTLSKNGITPDNIKSEAKSWFANYSKKLNIERPMTEGDIVQLYIKNNYVAALKEINNKLTSLYKQTAEDSLDSILRQIDDDPDFAVWQRDPTKGTNYDLATNKLGESELDATNVDGVIKNTESAETHFNGRISSEQSEIAKYRQKAKDSGRTTLSDVERDAIAAAERRIDAYKKIVEYLGIKKNRYQNWKTAIEQMEKEGIGTGSKAADEVFVYAGKEYAVPAGLNAFQRIWWKGWITRTLPLEFFSILGRLIYMAYTKRTFTDSFMEGITAMTNAIRKIESEGVQDGKDLAKMGEAELDQYGSRLYSDLVASVGKKMDGQITFKSFFSDGFGGSAGKMDIQDAFNRLENMLKSVEGITEVERQKIMSELFSRYMTDGGVPVKDLGNFRGFMYFNEDLSSLGVKSSYAKETQEAIEAGSRGVKDGKGKVLNFLNEWFYGAAAKQNWKSLLGNMFKKLITGVLIGIPSGLKWVMRPILKRGLGFKTVASVYFRLCLTKIAFVVSVSLIKFLGFLALYGIEYARINDITDLSGEEYAQQCFDNMLSDVGEGTLNALVPLHGIDIGWEEEQKDLKAPFGMSKYNAKFGIFESYGLEFFMEFKSLVFGKKDIDVKKEQKDLEQQALNEIDDNIDEGVKDMYDNMTPEQKEEIKKSAGYNTVKRVVSPTSEGLETLGITEQEAKNIESRLFFKPLFQGDVEMIKAHGSWKEFRKTGKKLSTKDVGGFTFLCSKEIRYDNKENPICRGEDYRVVPCNDQYFSQDGYFKEYIYNSDTLQVGTMSNTYQGKLVYIKNEAYKDKFTLSVGKNCENIGLVTELPFI